MSKRDLGYKKLSPGTGRRYATIVRDQTRCYSGHQQYMYTQYITGEKEQSRGVDGLGNT